MPAHVQGTPELVDTRARDPAAARQDSQLELALRAAGVRVREFALIHIAEPSSPAVAREALEHLEQWQLAVPVSPSAVHAVLRLRRQPWPATCAVGLIGAASREAFERALRARGEPASALQLIAASQAGADSEALWQALRAWRACWRGTRVLILRGDGGRDWLAETLRAEGACVQVVEAYRRVAPPADADRLLRLHGLLEDGAAWLLASAASVHNLCALLRAAKLEPAHALARQRALVHHPRVAQAARAAGFGRVDQVVFRAEALLQALHAGPRSPE